MAQTNPLVAAIARNDIAELRSLLSGGEDVNAVDSDGRTPLIHAAINGKSECVRCLVEAGADPNRQDRQGNSALHYAAQSFATPVVNLLLQHGARVDLVDIHGNTALWRAVFNSQGRGEAIMALLGAGADRNHKNKSGRSPLDLANTIGNYDIKKFFE